MTKMKRQKPKKAATFSGHTAKWWLAKTAPLFLANMRDIGTSPKLSRALAANEKPA